LAAPDPPPHQENRRRAPPRLLQRLVERGQRARSPDEGGAGHLPAHLAGIIPPALLDGSRVSTGSGPKDRDLPAAEVGQPPDSGPPVPAATSGRHKTPRHDEVDEMQQRSIPMIAPTRMMALSLLVTLVVIMTLVVVQLTARPAPDPPDSKPPMRFGPSTAHPMPYC